MDNTDTGTIDISGVPQGGVGGIDGNPPSPIPAPDVKAELAKIVKAQGLDAAGNIEEMLSKLSNAEPSDTSESFPVRATDQPVEALESEANNGEAAQASIQPNADDSTSVQVPDKFKTKDGGIDAEKVAKSTVNAVEALKKYETIEKELRKKQAEVNRAKMGLPTQGENVNPATAASPAESFEKQLEADVSKFGLGSVLARLFEATQQAAVDKIRGQVDAVAEQVNGSRMRAELEAIAKTDPGILTDDGMAELVRVREANPWVNGSENPWSSAHDLLLAQRIKQGSVAGMVGPNPKVGQVKAPATPIGPAPRPVTSVPKPIGQMSKAELDKYLAGKDSATIGKLLSQHLRSIGSEPGRL